MRHAIRKLPLADNIIRHKALYIMVLPGLIYFIIFKYIPLLGSVIAFQDYQIFRGLMRSPWVGMQNFQKLFSMPDFYNILKNTMIIGAQQIIFAFPAPFLLALLLSEVQNLRLKSFMQSIMYLPHFLSWAIIGSIIFDLLGYTGIVNAMRDLFRVEPMLYMQKIAYFRPVVIVSFIWKDIGWSAIIYLAAIAAISPNLYEAAVVEGASKFKQMLFITVPLLLPTLTVMLLLRIGNFLNLGFEQIYVLMTDSTRSVGDILDTYVYRNGIKEGKYSLTTAVGLFKSVFGLVLLVLCNWISNKTTGRGLY